MRADIFWRSLPAAHLAESRRVRSNAVSAGKKWLWPCCRLCLVAEAGIPGDSSTVSTDRDERPVFRRPPAFLRQRQVGRSASRDLVSRSLIAARGQGSILPPDAPPR